MYMERLGKITKTRKMIAVVLITEAVSTSETSVNFNVTTRRYIAEDSKLHTRRRENLKSHIGSFRDSPKHKTEVYQPSHRNVLHSQRNVLLQSVGTLRK
jgi:hypothetical protein